MEKNYPSFTEVASNADEAVKLLVRLFPKPIGRFALAKLVEIRVHMHPICMTRGRPHFPVSSLSTRCSRDAPSGASVEFAAGASQKRCATCCGIA